MEPNDKIQLFENQRIRTAWDEEKEEWYFSVVDVVAVLTDQPDQRHAAKYWSVLKTRLKKEGSELTTNCSQLSLSRNPVCTQEQTGSRTYMSEKTAKRNEGNRSLHFHVANFFKFMAANLSFTQFVT